MGREINWAGVAIGILLVLVLFAFVVLLPSGPILERNVMGETIGVDSKMISINCNKEDMECILNGL